MLGYILLNFQSRGRGAGPQLRCDVPGALQRRQHHGDLCARQYRSHEAGSQALFSILYTDCEVEHRLD